MKHAPFPDQTFRDASLHELLFWWPSITRRATEDWAKAFCQSILMQSKRRNWRPTAKQLLIMQRMHREHFTPSALGENDDLALIE